jgi:plasmid stabilization system protein ParE
MVEDTKKTSKNYQVIFSENASQNFDDIINFIAIENQNPLNAIKVANEFLSKFERLKKLRLLIENVNHEQVKLNNIVKQDVMIGLLFIKLSFQQFIF